MVQLRLLLIPLFCLASMLVLAQEICDNGIDDDADGLIDLLDPDCDCNGIDIIVPASLFPNPSFEDNHCQPGFGRANCADGWVNPSQGNPDYFDGCFINNILPVPTCNLPDGDKFFGITDINAGGELRKEYVGTRLTSAMVANERYVLSFWVGFVLEPDNFWSSPPVDFGIYGNTDPNATSVPFLGTDCPTSATRDTFGSPITAWTEIAQAPISNANGLGWQQIRLEFIALEGYESILIGSTCVRPNGANYYFLDNLVLSVASTFSNDFIVVQSGQACDDDLILEVPLMPNLDYQWYKNGIAMIGQTGSILNVPGLPNGNGDYRCRITNAFGCSMSEPFQVDESWREPTMTGPTGICAGDEAVIGLQTNYTSYTWEGFGGNPDITVTTPNIYRVTVVDNDGCILEAEFDLPGYADIQYTSILTKESAPGAQDGLIQIGHEIGVTNPSLTWWDASSDNPKLNLERGVYCVTVTADERCPVEECFNLEMEIQPIIVTEQLEAVRCAGEINGTIDLDILGGLPPLDITWRDHSEWNGLASLDNLGAGSYHVSIVDALGTLFTNSYIITQPDLLRATINSTAPSCHGSDDGSVWITDVQGGNGNYRYFWNGSAAPGAARIDGIIDGDFTMRLIDEKGCDIVLSQSVNQPDAIAATIELEHPYCKGADDGSIHISNIAGGNAPYQYFVDATAVESDVFDLSGDQWYSINIEDANGCDYTQEVYLANQVDFNVNLGSDQIIEEFYNANVRAISNLAIGTYNWTTSNGINKSCDNCAVFELFVESSDLVMLNAETIEGCIAGDSLIVTMTPSKRVYVPSAFSPNSDGINDEFELFNAGEVEQVAYFKVFNRQGVMVFKVEKVTSNEAMSLWNRTVQEHNHDSGTYVYVLGLEFKDGSSRDVKGDLSVIR